MGMGPGRNDGTGLIQQWITQVQAEKAVAEADLRRITGRRTTTPEEINTLYYSCGSRNDVG